MSEKVNYEKLILTNYFIDALTKLIELSISMKLPLTAELKVREDLTFSYFSVLLFLRDFWFKLFANVPALHAGCRLRRVNISVNYYYLQVQDNV